MERRSYSKEFKTQILQEASDTGNTAAVARKHGLKPELVYKWAGRGMVMSEQTEDNSQPKNTDAGFQEELQSRFKELVDKIDQIVGFNPAMPRSEELGKHMSDVQVAIRQIQLYVNEQCSEMKRMIHHLNRRIGDIDLIVHSMRNTSGRIEQLNVLAAETDLSNLQMPVSSQGDD